MITVLIADDHAFIRAGIESILRSSAFKIVATAKNGVEALTAIEEHDPKIVILDMQMPVMDGLSTLKELRHRGDKRMVVLLTAELEDRLLLDLIKLGVNGILLKDGAEDRLIICLEAVNSGQRWMEQDLVERVMDLSVNGLPNSPFNALAPRERKIVSLVARGMRNRDIANELAMTEGTVKVYLHGIYQKIGVENRTELAVLALQETQPIYPNKS